MIVLHCLPFIFSGTYLTYIFLLLFPLGLLFRLIRR